MKKHNRVLVLAGGPSAEHSISHQSGQMVVRALDRQRFQPTLCVITKSRIWRIGKLSFSEPQALTYVAKHFDVAFLALHGAYGEDGTIQSLLSSVGLRYTGSNVGASALAWDKALANIVAESKGLLVPKWKALLTKHDLEGWRDFPAFLKPMRNGSSIDVSIVRNFADARRTVNRLLRRYEQLMIQHYCHGRELTCGVIEDDHGQPKALPITEIQPQNRDFFDYEAKYTAGLTKEITPAKLPRALTRRIQLQAVEAHRAFGCHGLSRTDFILVKQKTWYLETNTIPGLTKLSLLPQEAIAAGMSFAQLLETIIDSTLRKGN